MATDTLPKTYKVERLSDNAYTVMSKFWLRRNDEGIVYEKPIECMRRVAKFIASAEDTPELQKQWEETFFEMLADMLASPNSPCYTGAGAKDPMMSACFVLPIPDSIEGIFEAVKRGALIHQKGGGTGYNFDTIRPEGARVSTTNGSASGPMSFIEVFDAATETIKQGSTRRGANMGCISISHPDILKFITSKERCNTCTECGHRPPLSNFNISVKVTNDFMEAVRRGDEEYPLIDPVTGKVAGKINPVETFELIAKMAWKNGEPGIIFIDRINEKNTLPGLGPIDGTNPCGGVFASR